MMTPFERFRSECESSQPRTFLALGSGMGSLVEQFRPLADVAFQDVPGLPGASVPGHQGRLLLGRRPTGQPVLLAQGRLHYYEGHPWEVVVRPVQIAASLGVKVVILTNAAGG